MMMIMMYFLDPKGSQAQSAPGWGPINYDDDYNNDNDDDGDEVYSIVSKFFQVYVNFAKFIQDYSSLVKGS